MSENQKVDEKNLSVVSIIPAAYLALINALAEAYGCGPNNMSVPLCTNGEVTHYGCHSFWRIEDYAAFTDDAARKVVIATLPPELQEAVNATIAALYERTVLHGDAQENWQAALQELGLTQVELNIE